RNSYWIRFSVNPGSELGFSISGSFFSLYYYWNYYQYSNFRLWDITGVSDVCAQIENLPCLRHNNFYGNPVGCRYPTDNFFDSIVPAQSVVKDYLLLVENPYYGGYYWGGWNNHRAFTINWNITNNGVTTGITDIVTNSSTSLLSTWQNPVSSNDWSSQT